MDRLKLKNFESKNIEYKEAKNQLPLSIYQTISAFANTKGGVIILGIKQDGTSIIRQGVENPQKLVDDLVSTISQKFNFCPVTNTFIEKIGKRYFIKIIVEEALRNEKPIYIKDAGPIKGGYKRIGSVNCRLTDRDVHRFYHEREGAPDAHVFKGTSLKDIDKKTVSLFRSAYDSRKKHETQLPSRTEDLLKAYKLLSKEGKQLTLAGILLFGKVGEIKRYIPHFRVDVIRIRGTEWGKDKDPFLSTDLRGNLFNIRMHVLDIFDRFFLMPFKLGKNLTRIDDDPFRNALREALSNLLMHQNYFHPSPSQIRIYNDRIEFYNPGYSLKDPNNFATPGSELRNSLIAPVFYDMGWSESKGTGFQTQILELKKYGLPEAHWESDEKNDKFTIIFPYPENQVGQKVTAQVEKRDRLAKILKFCEQPHTSKEMMQFINLKHRVYFLKEILTPLLEKKYLKRTIPDKPKSRFQKYVTNKKIKRSMEG